MKRYFYMLLLFLMSFALTNKVDAIVRDDVSCIYDMVAPDTGETIGQFQFALWGYNDGTAKEASSFKAYFKGPNDSSFKEIGNNQAQYFDPSTRTKWFEFFVSNGKKKFFDAYKKAGNACPPMYVNKFGSKYKIEFARGSSNDSETRGAIIAASIAKRGDAQRWENTNDANVGTDGKYEYSDGFEGFELGGGYLDCKSLLGESLTQVIRWARIGIQVAGISLCVIYSMIAFLGAISSKDADALNKAFRKTIVLAIVCTAILMLPTLISILGNLVDIPLECY